MKKHFKRLLFEVIFLLVDIATIFIILEAAKSIWEDMDSIGFFGTIFVLLIEVYIICGVELIFVRIFNFLHHYDDYDGFGEFLAALCKAPLAYIDNTIGHVYALAGLIYGIIRRAINPNYRHKGRNNKGFEEFDDKDNQEFIQDDMRKQGNRGNLEYKIHSSLLNKYGTGTWDRERFFRSEGRISVHVSQKTIDVKVNVEIQLDEERCTAMFVTDIDVKNAIDNYLERIQGDCFAIAEEELNSARINYRGFDGEYEINVSVSPKIS